MILQPASLSAARCAIGGSRGQSAGGSARAEDSGAYSARPRRKSPHRAHATSPRTTPHAAPRRRDCPPPSGPRAFADTGLHECVDVVLLSEEHLLALRRAGAHVPPAHAHLCAAHALPARPSNTAARPRPRAQTAVEGLLVVVSFGVGPTSTGLRFFRIIHALVRVRARGHPPSLPPVANRGSRRRRPCSAETDAALRVLVCGGGGGARRAAPSGA